MRVIVIGAGVAGLSIGWRLKQTGADVTVLERAQPGHGATWASAGMIAAMAEIPDGDNLLAGVARRSTALWPHFAHEIEEVSGVEVSYRADGTLIVAGDAEEADLLQQRAKRSPQLEFLTSGAAHALEPLLSPDIQGALFDPAEAQVDNRALAQGLGIAFQRAGGELKTNEAAVRFETEQGRVSAVRTPFAVHEADIFVLAAGAWSGCIEGLPAEAVPPIIPVKGEMIAVASKRDLIPRHMIWGNETYLVPRRNRLMVGATVSREGFDTRITKIAAAQLFSRAVTLMPSLARWAVVDHWAGLRPGSPDDLPLIGRSAIPGLLIASGQFRNGILFAPAIAEAIRDIILGQAIHKDIDAFDPRRFTEGAASPTY